MATTVDDTADSLRRVQEFDAQQLARRDTLGKSLSFEDAIPSARRVINFYAQIPLQYLDEITAAQRTALRDHSNAFWSVLEEIMNFDPAKVDNPNQARQALLDRINGTFESHFNVLFSIVSYLATRQHDFSVLERQARAATQAVEDEADKLKRSLVESENEAKRILDEVRKSAAEHGVSQQAFYFGQEADGHEVAAGKWQLYTFWTALGLGVFAALSLAVGNMFLVPDTTYEAFQLGISKVLVFATIAFMLILSARTLTAHRHNKVVNKHRQNALLTFNALVDAAGSEESRDIVLAHAANCIFAPQDSGFNKSPGSGTSASPLIELLPRLTSTAAS